MTSMPASRSTSISVDNHDDPKSPSSTSNASNFTIAAFSPTSSALASRQQRSSVVIHRKSPLLVATPPQVTRALAHSHSFLLPLSRLAGLLSWTTGDPWESFLLVCFFWGTVLYGDTILRYVGPIIFSATLILLMYLRRFLPLSSTGWTSASRSKKPTHKRGESSEQHQKSLDDVVASLNTFTARCQILLEPFLQLTDFLSTQSTATSATTRPALTALFWRILILTPVWYILTLRPLYIITTKRVVLSLGTLLLTWHSRPARASRTILWRSKLIRRTIAFLTGLDFAWASSKSGSRKAKPPPLPARPKPKSSTTTLRPPITSKASSSSDHNSSDKEEPGAIHFTFTLFENQRRWLGIGWTSSLLAYERSAWTDESLNATSSKDAFTLPGVTDLNLAHWRWAPDSKWHVEQVSHGSDTASDAGSLDADADDEGWVYTDNKWRDPKLQDSWGRYTRRRKWVRDAELLDSENNATPTVEITDDEGATTTAMTSDPGENQIGNYKSKDLLNPISRSTSKTTVEASEKENEKKKKSWLFRRRSHNHNREPSSDIDLPLPVFPGVSTPRASDTSVSPAATSSTATHFSTTDKTPFSPAPSSATTTSAALSLSDDDDGYVPLRFRFLGRENEGAAWGVGEDVGMELG